MFVCLFLCLFYPGNFSSRTHMLLSAEVPLPNPDPWAGSQSVECWGKRKPQVGNVWLEPGPSSRWKWRETMLGMVHNKPQMWHQVSWMIHRQPRTAGSSARKNPGCASIRWKEDSILPVRFLGALEICQKCPRLALGGVLAAPLGALSQKLQTLVGITETHLLCPTQR